MYLKLPNESKEKEEDRDTVNFDGFESPYRSRRSLMPRIQDKIKEYFECVNKGDLNKVKEIIDTPNFDENCTDIEGRSALHVALKRNDEAMVDYLLKRKKADICDCALYAIKLNQAKHASMILDKLSQLKYREWEPCVSSPNFPDYLTPMMLAAQCGQLEMISMLFEREHPPIEMPHRASCICDECITEVKGQDLLSVAAKKFDTYKAICNPAYICQVTEDPILRVFDLVDELRGVARRNRTFLRKYEELMDETQRFAADLMSYCRTTEEVETVLNEKEGTKLTDDYKFPRLILAVDCKQKYFVGQMNVQAVLEGAWIGDWYEWKGYTNLRRSVHFFGRILMLPVLYFVCIVRPSSGWAKFYSIPLNRMLSSVASYFIFLSLLFSESNRDKKNQTRYQITSHFGYLIFIWIYLASYIMTTFRMWAVQGTKRFFSFNWNLYDLVTELMLLLAFLFWLCGLITVGLLPDLERKYWHYLDPQLLWEGFFCIGTVLAFSRLLLLVQINDTLGPMQVSLAEMTSDCAQFVVIFGIIMFAFIAGMCRLYDYYDGMRQVDPETNAESRQESSFVGLTDTADVFFWGLFGMTDQDATTVVIENLPSEEGELESINYHGFTEAVGYALFAMYTVVMVVVLLNMLIAAMSNTFQKVTDNVDVEWIFGRTEVYLAYMSQTVLPPPLSFVCAGVGHNGCSEFFSNLLKKTDVEEAEKPLGGLDYKDLMVTLVKRYFSDKTKTSKVERNED